MCAPNSPVATSAWHARAAASSPSNNARGERRLGGGAEAGPRALVGVGGERELRHQQQAARRCRSASDSCGPLHLRRCDRRALASSSRSACAALVAALDADEREDAAADGAHGPVFDRYGRTADPLNQCYQSRTPWKISLPIVPGGNCAPKSLISRPDFWEPRAKFEYGIAYFAHPSCCWSRRSRPLPRRRSSAMPRVARHWPTPAAAATPSLTTRTCTPRTPCPSCMASAREYLAARAQGVQERRSLARHHAFAGSRR